MLNEFFTSRRWAGPVVIGGTGGSGTRLVARLLREMGLALGSHVNPAEDALAFVPVYDRYVNAYLQNGTVDEPQFEADLLRAIHAHLDPAGLRVWGWKNPRSIYLLPLLDRLVPGLRFVHVIRHGLDMALSSNQNQLMFHGDAAIGAESRDLPAETRAALLWQRVNEAAADHGSAMPGRYFLVRYEDVCAEPGRTLSPIGAALGLALPSGGWEEPVTPVAHRWPTLPPAAREAIKARIGCTLERFGYSC
jgi:hypothetical protein